jgi:predicted dehydrogenase
MQIYRRSFLKSSGALAILTWPAASYRRIRGANERIRLGVIGVRGRGLDHIAGMHKQVAAICDCDRAELAKCAGKLPGVQTFVDFRELCDDANIDAVSIATPNHSHALIGIHAIQAGKDVYVEKPVSHNVWEGRQLAEAAQKHGRVVQCGTQSRSSNSLMRAVVLVRSGKFGKILYAIGTCFKPRMSIGKLDQPLKIPDYLDYDLWCGPAEKRPLFRPQIHYDWHWDFNTGNGDMGNQGIHQMDVARWFLGETTIPPRVRSIGGRFGYDDAGNTPNSQIVLHDYRNAPLIFETRGLPSGKAFQDPKQWAENMDSFRGSQMGVVVQCERGHLVIPNYTLVKVFDNDGQLIDSWDEGDDHYANFLEAVSAGDSSRLNAPVLEGHVSSALCHAGSVSHQSGHLATLAEVLESLENESDLFKDSFQRLNKHLKANDVDLGQTTITLGATLQFEPSSEQIIGNEAANRLLARDYRKGFEVPKIAG